MSLASGTRLGPYEVLSPLGAGGMGEVYRARDTRLGRDVALKVIHPRLAKDLERVSRFEQEARAAAQLDHPNILVVHDIGSHEGSPYIVSELLQGESLRDKLGEPLPPKKAVELAVQIAHGLAAAHEKGIVHRDIKPENVFVSRDGRVKILDFGLAKLTQPVIPLVSQTEALTAAPETEPGIVMGTVGYMSPEQVQGKPLDARSDLFSLGVILYEMLCGKRPFQKPTTPEVMTAILKEEPPDVSDTNRSVSTALENVVRHILEKEPERRFQSARDVVFALETLPEVSSGRPAASMSPAGVWLRRHRRPLAGSALIVAMMRKLEQHILPPLLDGRADAFTLQNGLFFDCPALALLGRTDEAIRIFLRSVDAGVPPPYDWLLSDPDLRLLRSDPRFVKVLTASRDGAAKIARILDEARKRGELPKYLETPLDGLQRLLKEKEAKGS